MDTQKKSNNKSNLSVDVPKSQQQQSIPLSLLDTSSNNNHSLFQVHILEHTILLSNMALSKNQTARYAFTISNLSNFDLKMVLESDLNSSNTSPAASVQTPTQEDGENLQQQDLFQQPIAFQIFQCMEEQQEAAEMAQNQVFKFCYKFILLQLYSLVELVDRFEIKALATIHVVLLFSPFNLKSVPQKMKTTFYSILGHVTIRGECILPQPKRRKPSQALAGTTELKFSAQVCKSVLEVTVEDLDFGDCVVHAQKYNKDFTVWNRSDLATTFNLFVKVLLICI